MYRYLYTSVLYNSNSDNQNLDATKAFNLSLGAKVADQKDGVYGILGIANVCSLANVKHNYHLSLRQLYVDFSKTLLVQGGLNALRLVQQNLVAEINTGRIPHNVPEALNHSIIEPLVT